MSAVIETSANVVSPTPIAQGDDARAVAFDKDGQIALATFLGQVRGVAAALPAGRHAINLCEDRYRFLVAFCAVALRGQVNLLPPSRAPAVVADVLSRHADSYCLGDCDLESPPPHYWRLPDVLPNATGSVPMLADDALVAIGFTSGSTGRPQPNPKTWGSFRTSTAQNLVALGDLWGDEAPHLVATVPPQHMYGLELSVLLPLLGVAAVHAARPFFPEDIARALHDAQAPRVLVTTPVHLRALVEAGVVLPPLAGIVSATAPLAPELAAAAETRFGCEVRELFGSTETCVIARRRTAHETAWTPLPGVRLAPQPDGTAVHAPHLVASVTLADLVEIIGGDGRFLLCGRNADLLEIAGKRASLGDLTRKLLAIPGVEDGVVFQLDQAGCDGVRRIAALAVAPGLDEAAILAALRREIDPVFLPRPLKRVAALPRNDTGKLPRQALATLLQGTDS
ncbi:AMP-binding protein [Lysobacter sp. CFH 32150]|uniref:AMP-binding protein n=1 Tax=Lysobacter sp. CFH 32150 TaxID=2927128 RepID=UPI001FA6CD26|nr:AMP-binding protein [Lysobacter sp. CFH 32150]MCI4569191.1 AMP-binding protein [Lysobacter sp. CFH 32150]